MWFIYIYDFSAGIIAVLEWSTNSVNKEVVLYQSPDMFSGALGNLKRLLSYVMWLIVCHDVENQGVLALMTTKLIKQLSISELYSYKIWIVHVYKNFYY